ncbi:MAG: hypothetical protein AMJ78_09590 [Omnitrophica WOR_2 bacterium SM23_29]|nr:MAG: hypothetical protein AMJ78_09590 [Omnitrophica WOR_2 bacterium SM23_29]
MARAKYLIFGLIVGISFLNPDFVSAQSSSREAEVILVKGEVKVQKACKAEWLDSKAGMRLSEGDTVKTGKASMLEIAFDLERKNVVRLYENTTAILRGRWLREIGLPQGRVRFLIRRLRSDSSFEVRTPTAVAGVRGSGGEVESEEKRDEIKAFEDEIFVQSFDEQGNLIQEITITEGWETVIERFQAPGELMELTDADRSDWDSWKEDLSERREMERPPVEEEKGPDIGGAESVSETTQQQSEYKDQVFETQEDSRVEDRAASGETSGRGDVTEGGTPPPPSGDGCGCP